MLIRACEIAVFVCVCVSSHTFSGKPSPPSQCRCMQQKVLPGPHQTWLSEEKLTHQNQMQNNYHIHFHHIMVTISIDFHQVASCSGVVPATTAWPRNSEHSPPQPFVTGAHPIKSHQASMTLAHRWPRGLAFDPSLGAFTGASMRKICGKNWWSECRCHG